LWQTRNLHGHAPKPKQTRFFNRYRGNDLGRYLRRHKISSFPRELEAVREIYSKKQARVLYDKKSGFKSNIDISAYHALHISVHYSLYVNKTRDTLRWAIRYMILQGEQFDSNREISYLDLGFLNVLFLLSPCIGKLRVFNSWISSKISFVVRFVQHVFWLIAIELNSDYKAEPTWKISLSTIPQAFPFVTCGIR